MDIQKIKSFKPNKYQHGGFRGGGVGGLDPLENHKLLCFLRNIRIDPPQEATGSFHFEATVKYVDN